MPPKIPPTLKQPKPRPPRQVKARADDIASLLDAIQHNWEHVVLTADQMRTIWRLAALVGHPLAGEGPE